MSGYEVASFEGLESIPVAEGLVWHPIRRRFGVSAFGINAYTAERVGEFAVERHSEEQLGHEEIYALDAPVLVFPGDNIRIPERYF